MRDFTGEDVAPGEVSSEESADHRADGDGDSPGSDEAVCARTAIGREVAGHKRDNGGHDQYGAEALEERPAYDEHREVGRHAVVSDPQP